MADFLLSLGTSGLTKSDLSLRLYLDSARLQSLEDPVTVLEISSTGDYQIANVPDGYGHTLTYEYPPGVGGAYRWLEPNSAPANLILPIREMGLDISDLNLALYKDGAAQVDTLTAIEVGGDTTGDYSISGWPLDESGAWVLRWARNGITFAYGWVVPPISSTVESPFRLFFTDNMIHTVIWHRGSLDEFGDFTPESNVSLACRISNGPRLIRSANNQEIVSGAQVMILGAHDFSPVIDRFTLPENYSPRENLTPLRVDMEDDEVGRVYEMVYLP